MLSAPIETGIVGDLAVLKSIHRADCDVIDVVIQSVQYERN